MDKKRILLVASFDGSLIRFRGDFIKSLVDQGFEVFGAAPSFTETNSTQIKELGATPIQFNLQRTGLNPIKDYKSIQELNRSKIVFRKN